MDSPRKISKTDLEAASRVLEILTGLGADEIINDAMERVQPMEQEFVSVLLRYNDERNSISKKGSELRDRIWNNWKELMNRDAPFEVERHASKLYDLAYSIEMYLLDHSIKTTSTLMSIYNPPGDWIEQVANAQRRPVIDRIKEATPDTAFSLASLLIGLVPGGGTVTSIASLLKSAGGGFGNKKINLKEAVECLITMINGLWMVEFLEDGALESMLKYIDRRRKDVLEYEKEIDKLDEGFKKFQNRD